VPGFRRPRSASAERSGDHQGKKPPSVQGQHPQNETPHIQFQGMSRALSNQQSASSYQPTMVRLRRCCFQLLNLVGSCVHAVPILWGNNRTLVLRLSIGKCRRVRFTEESAEDTERKYKPPTQIECYELGDRRGRLSYRLWRDFYYRAVREPPLRPWVLLIVSFPTFLF